MNPEYRKLLESLSADKRARRNEIIQYMNARPSQVHLELQQEEREIVGYTEKGLMDEECDCPEFTFNYWAIELVNGKQYRRRTGPDIRFRFRFGESQLLEVAPHYVTNEQAVMEHEERLPEFEYSQLVDCNWQPTGDYSVGIFDLVNPRRRIHKGWLDGLSVYMVGDQSLTDAVAARLWDIHLNQETAFAGMPWCGVCKRKLTDEVSKAMGIGPECCKQLGISHGQTNARIISVDSRSRVASDLR